MDTPGVLVLMNSLVPSTSGSSSEVGVRDGAAFWKISSDVDASDYAVVWTPGDRWFAVDVAGGFSYTYFEEDATDEDVVKVLDKLTEGARAYIEGHRSTHFSRVWKLPTIRVETRDGSMELRLSLVGAVKRALQPRRAKTRGR